PLGTPPSLRSIANGSDPLNVRELPHRQLGTFLGVIDRRGASYQVRAMARSDAKEVGQPPVADLTEREAILALHQDLALDAVADGARAHGRQVRMRPLGRQGLASAGTNVTAELCCASPAA